MCYFNSRDPYGPRFRSVRSSTVMFKHFNSRDHTGRDPVLGAFRPRAPDFNSRDRTDRDSFLACIWAAISHFNSHDPTSRDGNMQQISGLFVISIHATYTGRDFKRSHPNCCKSIFQFTRPYRPRCVYHCSLNVLMSISIHATPTGRDLSESIAYLSGFISIHATPTGRDAVCRTLDYDLDISIHATHTGRDP